MNGGLYFEDYSVGQRFKSAGRTVTDADIRMYLGASGTAHPNHTDEEYCKHHPILEGVCAPGVLVLGLVDAFIADTVTRHMASSMNYGHDRVRYLKPVYTRDTVHAELEVCGCDVKDDQWGLVKLHAFAVNQHDERVLFDAHVIVVQRRSSTGGDRAGAAT
jgi:3-hydroxybutyryl-CoA dehydratase